MIRLDRLGLVSLAAGLAVLVAGCERPPVKAEQKGYRGLGMEQVKNPRTEKAVLAAMKIPDALPKASAGGPKAGTVYKNVKVLGDLSEEQFNRVMGAITEWVAPEQGCAYCHNVENMADGSKYTHAVARRMLQMTRQINETWKPHVGATGVTCYTCHAGNPVPKNIWFKDASQINAPFKHAGYRADGQNLAHKQIGLTSLPGDPFQRFLAAKEAKPNEIRVIPTKALPSNPAHPKDVKDAEATYALMIHMSQGLGVNCTYCHNTRSFFKWEQSTPQRLTAWHGIRMVQDINQNYLDPLKPVYPANRLGASGDAPKAFCTTCHQGQAKPLNGKQMLKDYLELNTVSLAKY